MTTLDMLKDYQQTVLLINKLETLRTFLHDGLHTVHRDTFWLVVKTKHGDIWVNFSRVDGRWTTRRGEDSQNVCCVFPNIDDVAEHLRRLME